LPGPQPQPCRCAGTACCPPSPSLFCLLPPRRIRVHSCRMEQLGGTSRLRFCQARSCLRLARQGELRPLRGAHRGQGAVGSPCTGGTEHSHQREQLKDPLLQGASPENVPGEALGLQPGAAPRGLAGGERTHSWWALHCSTTPNQSAGQNRGSQHPGCNGGSSAGCQGAPRLARVPEPSVQVSPSASPKGQLYPADAPSHSFWWHRRSRPDAATHLDPRVWQERPWLLATRTPRGCPKPAPPPPSGSRRGR
uniref:Uncharacterized protein n=1 Tax=Anas platyrhynchos TaxID=8839 RepID=A0A8B9T917_ANAPL